MTKIRVVMPMTRETKGALRFEVPGPIPDTPIGAFYLRKDHLVRAGHTGPWPTQMTVTVETTEGEG